MADTVVRRVDLGYFIRPAEETGTGHPRVEPTLGYLIQHALGTVLVDTGMGSHPEVDAWYRPRRIPLHRALAAVDAKVEDVGYVVNCHLHFDHCGGNPAMAGRPVFTQRAELSTARTTEDYTLPPLIDYPGAHYEELDGETEILPGVVILPTPGHTAGHQSVVVARKDGTVIVAGQSHDNASLYTGDVLSQRAGVGHHPVWMDRLLAYDPREVVFAHDNAVWTPC
jgi:N-acyl homoserine lactone hydrolase